jgi:O-antigen ligase
MPAQRQIETTKAPGSWLDFAIVASLLLVPHSYYLWINSSEFGASAVRRIPFFLLPVLLIAMKLTGRYPRPRPAMDPVVVFLWLVVLLQGLVVGLINTRFPGNTLSVYAQYLYWFAVVSIYLSTIQSESTLDIFDIIRRYFIAVSIIAWAFGALFFVFGERLPHRSLLMPTLGSETILAENFYVTLAYSAHSVFGRMIPRFAFLYREPRVLGMQLVMGFLLQIGYNLEMWHSWGPRQRRRGVLALILIGGTFFWAHSVDGYLYAFAMTIGIGAIALMKGKFWRRFRLVHLTVIGLGIGALIAGYLFVARQRDLAFLVQDVVAQNYVEAQAVGGASGLELVGKPSAYIADYITTFLSSPRRMALFPMGTGIMNLDSDRYMSEYGVPTNGGGTLLQFFALNAGFVGVVAFGVIIWRILGRMRRLTVASQSMEVRYACFLAGFLLVMSTIFIDILSTAAFGPLIIGAIMKLRPEASA